MESNTQQPRTRREDAAAAGPVEIVPVTGIAEVRPGDDLGEILLHAVRAAGLRDGDVLCISTKIVSKALGLTIGAPQRDAAIERAAVRTVARRRHGQVVTSVVQIPSGPVMAAAGLDLSNAPDGPLLLPEDPDACAATLHRQLSAALGARIGVILSDTSSRIWRMGVGDIALGAAGIASLQDLRGAADDSGRTLSVTVRNLADEIAAAADLVKGKASRVPAAIVRGVPGALGTEGPADDAHGDDAPAAAAPGHEEPHAVPARALSRTGSEDWFRRPSLESVWEALGLSSADEPIAAMSPEPDAERIARALAVAASPRDPDRPSTARADLEAEHRIVIVPGGEDTAHWAEAGALAERIRTALGAESIARPLPEVRIEITEPASAPTPSLSAVPSSPEVSS